MAPCLWAKNVTLPSSFVNICLDSGGSTRLRLHPFHLARPMAYLIFCLLSSCVCVCLSTNANPWAIDKRVKYLIASRETNRMGIRIEMPSGGGKNESRFDSAWNSSTTHLTFRCHLAGGWLLLGGVGGRISFSTSYCSCLGLLLILLLFLPILLLLLLSLSGLFLSGYGYMATSPPLTVLALYG